MKKKLLLLLILILLFAVLIAVKFLFLNKQSGFGQLKALSSPDASIFINNIAIGKTPYEDKIKEGEYMIKFIPEGTASDTASWQGKITIYKNTLTYLDRELGSSDLTSSGVIFTTKPMTTKAKDADFGEIEVQSEPAGSIVYLDNDEKGIAPLVLSNVVKGEHDLSVYSPGFFKRTQKINVDSGYRVVAEFKLALDPSQKTIALTPSPTPKQASSSAEQTKNTIQILDTPTGFLRVRSEPSVDGSEEAQLKPQTTYPLIEEQPNWYKIEYESGKQGWVASQYAKKI